MVTGYTFLLNSDMASENVAALTTVITLKGRPIKASASLAGVRPRLGSHESTGTIMNH